MYWDEGNSKAVSHRFRHEGEQQNGLIIKQMPMAGPPQAAPAGMEAPADPMMGGMPAPPKSAVGMAFDAIDSGIQALAGEMAAINDLLAQVRATNIDPQMTMALQGDMEKMRQKQLSLTADLSMIREMHASLGQHGQPAADPMTAAMGQQAPMNMPQEMPPMDAATMPQQAM
tara:strand:- start:825 stop:1340 length:516 start_codon:yes stop_codon:yes gene_type:complete